jgi:hypothetical protein
MARNMLEAADQQAKAGKAALDVGEAANRIGKAQAELFDRWINFWNGRL